MQVKINSFIMVSNAAKLVYITMKKAQSQKAKMLSKMDCIAALHMLSIRGQNLSKQLQTYSPKLHKYRPSQNCNKKEEKQHNTNVQNQFLFPPKSFVFQIKNIAYNRAIRDRETGEKHIFIIQKTRSKNSITKHTIPQRILSSFS